MKLHKMNSGPKQSTFNNPRWGLLIPSPLTTHTHAVACHPFDPNALLTVEGRLRYLSEHAIKELPLEQQAIHNAGQVIVVREMNKLRRVELQEKRIQSFPELELTIHGNPNSKPLADIAFWRKTLGWAGVEEEYAREQFHRYTTLLPGMSRLLKGVQDRSVWDHKTGEWQITTHSAVQQAKKRRDWVSAELERIDALRYEVMADWKQKTEEGYLADCNEEKVKKRGRDDDNEVAILKTSPNSELERESDQEDTKTRTFKRPKISADASIEPMAKRPRPSIEPPFEFPPPEHQIPNSQTTLSSLTASPDSEHDTRSQAPEPESPLKATFPLSNNEESMRRYTFVLDIPTTDNQRVAWLKFLDQYHWDAAMISALRRFFYAEPSPNTSMTKRFLERLWEVAERMELVGHDGVEEGRGDRGEEGEEKHKLLWDRKVKVLVDEVAVLATPKPVKEEDVSEGRSRRFLRRQQPQTQPTWFNTPSVFPLSRMGMPSPMHSGNWIYPALTVSPSDARVRALGLPVAKVKVGGEEVTNSDAYSGTDCKGDRNRALDSELDIPALMKEYVSTLSKGDKVEVPCDKCRALSLECQINQSSCRRCARRHDRCVWNEAEVGELRELGLLGGETLKKDEKVEEGNGDAVESMNADRCGDSDGDEVRKSGEKRGPGSVGAGATKLLRSRVGRLARNAAVDGARKIRKIRRKSAYDFPEDGDDTRGFLEDEEDLDSDGGNGVGDTEGARAMNDGNETKAFLDLDGEETGDCGDDGNPMDVETTDEEEDEWMPSSGR